MNKVVIIPLFPLFPELLRRAPAGEPERAEPGLVQERGGQGGWRQVRHGGQGPVITPQAAAAEEEAPKVVFPSTADKSCKKGERERPRGREVF